MNKVKLNIQKLVKFETVKRTKLTGGHWSFVKMSLVSSGTCWSLGIFTNVLILLFRESAGRSWRVTRRRSSAPVYAHIRRAL